MKTRKLFFYIHIRTTNNPNPRRCYAVFRKSTGELLNVLDEGYAGTRAMDEAGYPYEKVSQLTTINVAPAEYNRWIRTGKLLRGELKIGKDKKK
jgi:hypothetical protein